MNLKNVKAENDRRCRAEVLAKLVEKAPLEVRGSDDLQLTARMGLGRIIYIEATKGTINGWTLGNDARLQSKSNGVRFLYEGLTYSLIVPVYQAT